MQTERLGKSLAFRQRTAQTEIDHDNFPAHTSRLSA
jgi:hypothetical protein